jgi:hypothetical protein
VFDKASERLEGVEIGRKATIEPYAVGLDPARWDADGLFSDTGISAREARKPVRGLQFAWLDEFGGDIGSSTLAEQAEQAAPQ